MKTIFWSAAFLIIYAYLLYPIGLFMFRKIGKINFYNSYRFQGISLIISAYNEESVIEDKILNILKLNYPKELLEIIIASDGSSDRTNEIVKRYSNKGIILKEYKKRRGKVNILNDVIPKAKNEIIVLSDANTFFRKDSLKQLVRNFGDDRVGCVCGELVFKNSRKNKIGDLEGFYWKYEVFLKKLEGERGSLLGANGGIYAIRKSLFEKVPKDTIVEDFVIPMKIMEKGYKVLYEKSAIAYEETAKSVIQEMARRVRIGAGDFQALILCKRLLNPMQGFRALSFWSHKVLRWFAPFFLIIALFSNVFLIGEKHYLWLFLAQICFYFIALIGRLMSSVRIHIKIFSLAHYFVSMNIALLAGFFKFATRTQRVTWERTER